MRAIILSLIVILTAISNTSAEPIVAGSATQPYINIQQIRLFAGTPFNPGTEAVEFELIAHGVITATWESQVGSTLQHAVPFADFEGLFPGDIPFHILAGTPDLPPTVGEFTNVVQNPADPGFASGAASSLISADYRNTAYFKQVLPDGTTIYSDLVNPAVFTSTLAGLPYPTGQEFIGTEPLNLYLQLGPTIDQANDLLIGQSLHRIVRVVPEPAAWSIVVLGVTCLYGRMRRRTQGSAERHTM